MAASNLTSGVSQTPSKDATTAAQADGATEALAANGKTKKRQNNKRKANYNHIHRFPLPLTVHPLPAFHPTNPISILRLTYVYLAQLLMPPTSHPPERYTGYWSAETRSVHVTDAQQIRALWEMGFFGKGTLSRSEPSWFDRETARLMSKRAGGGTAEEATNARREKRKAFKLERARAEAEKIERQRLVEEGKLDPIALEVSSDEAERAGETVVNGHPVEEASSIAQLVDPESANNGEEVIDVENQEHLQLNMEEAFFLTYGLGVLNVLPATGGDAKPHTTDSLLHLFANHGYFPPRPETRHFAVDDTFMLNYVTYHHFRSLGWVVRPGVKFSVDYMLYLRGPVFSHAEFAVIIMPAYTDSYWKSAEGLAERRIKEDEQKDWWWLHCVNRVQSQVLKSLVLVYVDIPRPLQPENGSLDIGRLLKGYKIREFILKRWVANRMRD